MAMVHCSITRCCCLAGASVTATGIRMVLCLRCCWAGPGMGIKERAASGVHPDHTPLTNLQMTLLNKLGVPTEKLGDSTGQFRELSELA